MIVNQFYSGVISIKAEAAAQRKIAHRGILVKVENYVVEICELSVVESHLVPLATIAFVLKTDARADGDALLTVQSYNHD